MSPAQMKMMRDAYKKLNADRQRKLDLVAMVDKYLVRGESVPQKAMDAYNKIKGER